MLKLSKVQEQIINIDRFYGKTSINTLGYEGVYRAEFTKEDIVNGLVQFIRNTDALHVQFVEKDGEVYQKFVKPTKVDIGELVFSNQEEFDNFINDRMSTCLFGYNQPLYQFYIVERPDGKLSSLSFIHHSIADGWSIVNIYTKQMINVHHHDKNVNTASYSKYLEKLKPISNKTKERAQKYWKEKLSSYDKTYEVTLKGEENDFSSKRVIRNLDLELVKAIHELATGLDVTVPVVFLAAFILMQSRQYSESSSAIGMATLGRHKKERDIFGYFIQYLPFITTVDEECSVEKFIKYISKEQFKFFRNLSYSYESVMELMEKVTGSKKNLISSNFSFQNASFDENMWKVYDDARWLRSTEQNIPLSFSISSRENEEHYFLEIDYRLAYYNEEDINLLIDRYIHILAQFCKNAEQSISQVSAIDKEEQATVIYKFNPTTYEIDESDDVISVFKKSIRENPDKIAVTYQEQEMTFNELDKLSDDYAAYLISRNISKGDGIVIYASRSLEMIAAIFGILKAGAYYIPIDIKAPETRVNYIIADSNAKLVFISEDLETDFIHTQGEIVDLKSVPSSTKKIKIKSNLDDLAYCMYTSGTTGNPKGTLIKHRSIIRLVKYSDFLPFDQGLSFMQIGSMAFDAATLEIFGGLLNGGSLHLESEENLLDLIILEETMRKRDADAVFMTSSFFNLCVDNQITIFEPLDHVMAGGDVLSEIHLKRFREYYPDKKLYNGYGPTETTTFVTTYDIPKEIPNPISIGRPIGQTRVYILHGNQLQGIGMIGELCVAGDGLSQGYLNNDRLTEEKFVANPIEDGIIYRTGDIAYWSSEGLLYFLGRRDQQVKIRGFRIELKEIQIQINQFDNVAESHIEVREFDGSKCLVAYIVLKDDEQKEEFVFDNLRNYLSKQFPEYMIPIAYKIIDKIPLTMNGKVDRATLPSIEIQSRRFYEPAQNVIEAKIINIYKQGLDLKTIGRNDNFFELGGDSIKAMKIASLARKDNVYLNAQEILRYPTPKFLADFIQEKGNMEVKTSFSIPNLNIFSESSIYRSIKTSDSSIDNLYKSIEKLLNKYEVLNLKIQNKKLIIPSPSEDKSFEVIILKNSSNLLNIYDYVRHHFTVLLDDRGDDKTIYLILPAAMLDSYSWETVIKDFEKIYNNNEFEEELINFSDYCQENPGEFSVFSQDNLNENYLETERKIKTKSLVELGIKDKIREIQDVHDLELTDILSIALYLLKTQDEKFDYTIVVYSDLRKAIYKKAPRNAIGPFSVPKILNINNAEEKKLFNSVRTALSERDLLQKFTLSNITGEEVFVFVKQDVNQNNKQAFLKNSIECSLDSERLVINASTSFDDLEINNFMESLKTKIKEIAILDPVESIDFEADGLTIDELLEMEAFFG
ncbi:MAG TPA: amino acid adenylation domain-containing protein [Clostridiaceae bacterium]|nr:amino acid adenylation domain-containing protein [Clostridiaceae bacterium]